MRDEFWIVAGVVGLAAFLLFHYSRPPAPMVAVTDPNGTPQTPNNSVLVSVIATPDNVSGPAYLTAAQPWLWPGFAGTPPLPSTVNNTGTVGGNSTCATCGPSVIG